MPGIILSSLAVDKNLPGTGFGNFYEDDILPMIS
jgi:hypothetical protein